MTIICKKCVAAGEKYSLRYGGVCARTCMGFYPFVDDEGRRHYHDSNTGGDEYWFCSNGHEVVEEEHPSCWCGWPITGKWAEEDRKQREDRDRRIAERQR